MMGEFTPETAVQDACIRLMLADPALTALVGDRIYDEPPDEGATFPFIHLEAMNSKKMDVGCGTIKTVTMRYFAVSGNDFGRLLAWKIANAMALCLEDAEPKLAEGFRRQGPILHVQSSNVIEPGVERAVAVDILCSVSSKAVA